MARNKNSLPESLKHEQIRENNNDTAIVPPLPDLNDSGNELPAAANPASLQTGSDTPVSVAGEPEKQDKTAGGHIDGDTPPKAAESPNSSNPLHDPPPRKQRIRHDTLKSQSVIVFDGTLIPFDETGTAEIEAPYAAYLLQIPSYHEVP